MTPEGREGRERKERVEMEMDGDEKEALCKKASNHHAKLPLEMYSFTL